MHRDVHSCAKVSNKTPAAYVLFSAITTPATRRGNRWRALRLHPHGAEAFARDQPGIVVDQRSALAAKRWVVARDGDPKPRQRAI
jgi:hypothetical protein